MTNILTNQAVFCVHMPEAGETGRIYAWVAGGTAMRTFTGKPYSQWVAGEVSGMRTLHDSLNQMHAEALHRGEIISIQPNHRDYAALDGLMNAPAGDAASPQVTARNRVLMRSRVPVPQNNTVRRSLNIVLRKPTGTPVKVRTRQRVADASFDAMAEKFHLVPAANLGQIVPA